ncbi:MAG TPA: hypothetical protein VD846_11910 [Allosphingosinicella sp.]|nr:hypothetical protein [Allosphingosinicella sp.]
MPFARMISDLRQVLKAASSAEAGKRFLINLSDALAQRDLQLPLVDKAIRGTANLSGSGLTSWRAFLEQFSDVVFGDPDTYQFRGPLTEDVIGQWITVRSYADLVHSVRSTSGLTDNDVRTLFGVASLDGPLTGIRDERAEWLAEFLSDESNGIRFALARSFMNPVTGSPRFGPSWYSRWRPFRQSLPDPAPPTKELAGPLRDWLGLGHFRVKQPLFLFKTKRRLPSQELRAHRPTVFDGFDNKLYKHRSSASYASETSGSTIDIAKVRASAASPTSDLEGGPEIVSRGYWYSPDHVSCQYVGKAPPLNIHLDCTYLHKLMLPDGVSLDDVIERLANLIASSGGNP